MKTVFLLLAVMLLPERIFAGAVETVRAREKTAISADEMKILAECFASIQPGDSAALLPHAPAEVVQFCIAWKGYSQRAASNPDLNTDYIDALGEFYSSRPRRYVECLAKATASFASWQKQQIYEAEVSERESRLYEAIDRRRIMFRDEGPAREVNNCHQY
ncbi:hypothetical protein QN219_06825 [Sinorhizobium sp. 7-81]|uniref:hypothetical protein n=1 Tax=Sinorhizobium sp. 8-89 TaxID=3049089 RepID=UPI0024C38C66|nr:hypothetical protein [Sinorhizobium sp. 8-89]MDK1489769.1 hypothetical protein [Sinorhizobium sp. 8-89]